MLRTFAIIFGIVFLLVGVLGYVPQMTPNGHLLGLFHVNSAHNIVHILSGVIALLCGLTSIQASRIYFCVFGIVYGIVTLLGFFVYGNNDILGIIANNTADNFLHLGITVISLLLGFCCYGRCAT